MGKGDGSLLEEKLILQLDNNMTNEVMVKMIDFNEFISASILITEFQHGHTSTRMNEFQ